MDDIDVKLLTLLQKNGSISNVELSEAVKLSPPGVHKRLKRLEAGGYIDKYTALLDREQLGYDLLCFIHITLASHQRESLDAIRERVLAIPEILECYEITGETDVLLKVVVYNRQHLQQILFEFTENMPQIDKVRTAIALEEMKSTTILPISP